MKRYPKNDKDITESLFTKFKIVVPTRKDKKEIMEAFENIHYSQFRGRELDTGYVTVCQLVHEYGDHAVNIVLDKKAYNKLSKIKK
jgi:hypothetical protein